MPEEQIPEVDIVNFETVEALLEYLGGGQAAADAAMTPIQVEIGWGEHVISFDERNQVFVFGKIEDEENFIRYETEEASSDEEEGQHHQGHPAPSPRVSHEVRSLVLHPHARGGVRDETCCQPVADHRG